MAFNKSKHIESAQKYLMQGKLPQSIAEYQQILKHEPKDQVTLMTLGDLYVRQGETFQALEYFERLAKIFLNDGFTTKAIAIYKKVAKLAPEESRPLERLAELYVQQGVLSEARPLFLQLAEVQLKAGKEAQAAALFRKLLDAEPDNMRVQTRLGDLYLSMGQSKDAAEIFHSAAQHFLDRGDHLEAIRVADRVLQIDVAHVPTLIVKARALAATNKLDEAAAVLEPLPEKDAGGEVTSILLEQYLDRRQADQAENLAKKVFARDAKQFALVHRTANALLESGEIERARNLVALVRNRVTDAGDHEALAQTISRLAERGPENIEPLQWLVDLFGRASDSFRLPDALAHLAEAFENQGDEQRALETYEQLLDRNPEAEAVRGHCVRLREKLGLQPLAESPAQSKPAATPGANGAAPRPAPDLDDETKRYVTQALTDVDLFSSYGLTQKAIDLLEKVLQRAPRYVPILERLLDLSVGAGNDRRTAELAALLEQIATERKDQTNVERYAELRRRFARAAQPSASSVVATGDVPEFKVQAGQPEPAAETPASSPAGPPAQLPALVKSARPAPPEPAVHEVDLSDEWAALSQQLEEAMDGVPASAPAASEPHAPAYAKPLSDPLPLVSPDAIHAGAAKPPAGAAGAQADNVAAPLVEPPSFDLELLPSVTDDAAGGESFAADMLLAELGDDLESATSFAGIPAHGAAPVPGSQLNGSAPTSNAPAKTAGSKAAGENGASATAANGNGSGTGPLGDLFDDFRSELGEMGKSDEDIETHYNLGVAYREMGLLEEAISEFQKVAKSSQDGPAFRYAMQCCTLLALTFMEKGQPSIAVIWYERALKTPELDPEAILALRYDLGIAQELAGETDAAFKSFAQVYAMNIDYRDVSERIALLGKAH